MKHECHYTYTVNTYYPSIHSFANVMSDTWYKYNVSLPITIKVYNGTSPTTQITSRFFSATSPNDSKYDRLVHHLEFSPALQLLQDHDA